MDVVVSVHFTVRVHDDDFFERRLKNALKLFVTLNGFSRLSKFIFEYQCLGRLQLFNKVFDVPDDVRQGIVLIAFHGINFLPIE